MAQRFNKGSNIRELMTKDPITCAPDSTVADAARAMREKDIGDVLIVDGERLTGLVTDRDIAVRAVAEGREANSTAVSDIATTDLATLEADSTVEDAIRLMRERDIRRLPITDGGSPVGIISLGDLALARDEDSVLADISGAGPNN